MKKIAIAAVAAAGALAAGACGGEEEPQAPAPTEAPTERRTEPPTKPKQTPDPQEPAREPAGERGSPEDTRPLPEECRHPAGGSVRQSCIEEFGPEGVGSVQPVPPEWDQDGDGIDDSVEVPNTDPESTPPPSEEPQDSGPPYYRDGYGPGTGNYSNGLPVPPEELDEYCATHDDPQTCGG